MFKKAKRINKRDFKRIYRKGKFKKGFFINLKYFPNFQRESRYAVVISSNLIKKATKRNNLKRKIMETIRLAEKEIKKGFDFVIIFKKEPKEEEIKKIKEEVLNLLKNV